MDAVMATTPHGDLVARLRRLRLSDDSGSYVCVDSEIAIAIDAAADALAALPPPADPPEPWGHPDLIEGLDMAAVILREVGATESAEHCDTAARLLTSGPADPPALVALPRYEMQSDPRHGVVCVLRADGEWVCYADVVPAAPPVTASTPTHVEIDHDGDLSIDFDRANDRVVSLTIYRDGRVGYSALVDGESACGIVTAAEPMPSWVRAAICAPPVTDTLQGWQPIETAPKDREILVFVNGVHYCVSWFDDGLMRGWADGTLLLVPQPRVWQPLPAAPPQEDQ